MPKRWKVVRRWWFKRKLIRRARRMGWLDAIPQEWQGRKGVES